MHDVSKETTLPIAREIVHAVIAAPVKAPWYIDLLNLNIGVEDLEEARRRIDRYPEVFREDGSRITHVLDLRPA